MASTGDCVDCGKGCCYCDKEREFICCSCCKHSKTCGGNN